MIHEQHCSYFRSCPGVFFVTSVLTIPWLELLLQRRTTNWIFWKEMCNLDRPILSRGCLHKLNAVAVQLAGKVYVNAGALANVFFIASILQKGKRRLGRWGLVIFEKIAYHSYRALGELFKNVEEFCRFLIRFIMWYVNVEIHRLFLFTVSGKNSECCKTSLALFTPTVSGPSTAHRFELAELDRTRTSVQDEQEILILEVDQVPKLGFL